MASASQPLVSIGVPVFNGENGLARALDSLLAQDYPNLEIIISDNASTDATPAICESYVRKDSRVKYVRSEINHGAVDNFNRVFQLSSGKYFMWAAHDDQRHRFLVSTCVAKMEQCPEAALCQARIAMFIEGREELLCVAHMDSFEGVTRLVERYRETLKRFPSTAVYGLYRSALMRKTHMWQKIMASDLAFIQELSIYGEFVQVPQVLFSYVGRKDWNTIHEDYRAAFGIERKPWWYLPSFVLFCNHWKRVSHAAVPFRVKLRLWCVLIQHEAGQVLLKVMTKLVGRICPRPWKEKVGSAIYWRWMHSPNLEAARTSFYLERVIKPKLGWWRS